jgi:FlaA1/EpsC-like NDP-sugar epimerase
MGELVNISNLARDLIRLSGYHDDEIKIEYTGLRPGEKLYEELLVTGENSRPTEHPKLRMAISPAKTGDWLRDLTTWIAQEKPMDDDTAKRYLALWVPEFGSPDVVQNDGQQGTALVRQLRRVE